jgi:hypothetical protein
VGTKPPNLTGAAGDPASELIMLHPILADLLLDLRERYADIPGFTIEPYHRFPDTALELTSLGKFSHTIGWHPEDDPKSRLFEVYLPGGPLEWNGTVHHLDLADPEMYDRLYRLLDGYHRTRSDPAGQIARTGAPPMIDEELLAVVKREIEEEFRRCRVKPELVELGGQALIIYFRHAEHITLSTVTSPGFVHVT